MRCLVHVAAEDLLLLESALITPDRRFTLYSSCVNCDECHCIIAETWVNVLQIPRNVLLKVKVVRSWVSLFSSLGSILCPTRDTQYHSNNIYPSHYLASL